MYLINGIFLVPKNMVNKKIQGTPIGNIHLGKIAACDSDSASNALVASSKSST